MGQWFRFPAASARFLATVVVHYILGIGIGAPDIELLDCRMHCGAIGRKADAAVVIATGFAWKCESHTGRYL